MAVGRDDVMTSVQGNGQSCIDFRRGQSFGRQSSHCNNKIRFVMVYRLTFNENELQGVLAD